MTTRVVADTNVLLYAIDNQSVFHFRARRLLLSSDIKTYVVAKSLSEFLVVLTRGSLKRTSITKAVALLDEILDIVEVLYPDSQTLEIMKKLLQKYSPKGLKIYDFEIASVALGYDLPKIATFNRDDFKKIKEIELIDI